MAEQPSDEILRRFHGKRLVDRQIDELIGLSRGLAADGRINQAEAEYLQTWLVANMAVSESPLVRHLLDQVNDVLCDGQLGDDEAADLLKTLKKFSGDEAKVELGETLKSTSLPLDVPAPTIVYLGVRFCFTGKFLHLRSDCEDAVVARGGEAGSLTKNTRYLVVGDYAADAWVHSTWGRKIERAMEMRAIGIPIAIISEGHWKSSLTPG